MATATIISYPDNEINETLNITETLNSYELVQNLWVDLSETTTDEYVEIIYNGETVTLYLTEECRYTPLDIFFMNKDGGLQSLTFFKAKEESLSVTKKEFESLRGQPSNNGSHQFKQYNKQGREKFNINSGFVDESLNETFKQLFLSERVWVYDGVFTPINLDDSTIRFKSRQNDRLINYEVKFIYAFHTINNI